MSYFGTRQSTNMVMLIARKVTRMTMAPPGNIMPYIPLKSSTKSPCSHNWHTFVTHIGMDTDADHLPNKDAKRLGVFVSFDSSPSRSQASLPRILPDAWWNYGSGSPEKASSTWMEILLANKEGKWSKALSLDRKKKESSGPNDASTVKGRNTPLSTIPFVQ